MQRSFFSLSERFCLFFSFTLLNLALTIEFSLSSRSTSPNLIIYHLLSPINHFYIQATSLPIVLFLSFLFSFHLFFYFITIILSVNEAIKQIVSFLLSFFTVLRLDLFLFNFLFLNLLFFLVNNR